MRQLKIIKSFTNRNDTSLDKYLSEIGRYGLITTDKEIELAQKIKAGDNDAIIALTNANLRFVVSVAKQYQNQGLGLSDLINEGNLGLIKAAGKFDETRGFKFISYAVWWIRQSIIQAISEHSRIVRLPLNQVSSLNKYRNAANRFEHEFQRAATVEELAAILELPIEKVIDSIRANGKSLSVDAPFGDENDGCLLDVMENHSLPKTDQGSNQESLKIEIERAFSTLTEREVSVLKLTFGLGVPEASLEEIGYKLALTSERVRQIKKNALKKLQTTPRSKLLKTYLG